MQDKDYSFRIADLLAKFVRGTLSVEETEELDNWLEEDPKHKAFFEQMNDPQWQQQSFEFFDHTDQEKAWNIVSAARREAIQRTAAKNRKRMLYSGIGACLLLTLGFYFFHSLPNRSAKVQAPVVHSAYGDDVSPGYMHAELITSGGQRITLSDSVNGNIGGYASNLRDRGLLYYAGNPASNEMHTLKVPDKGTYRLVLQDGSAVWLNAGSSLRYPVPFTGRERKVELSGEAFFAVAKDKVHPFRVYCRGSVTEAVGTAFNVNGYHNGVITTLVEGKVRVSDNRNSVILVPGNSANISADSAVIHVATADTTLTTGWKKGDFIFLHTAFGEVLEQLSRWYGVTTAYQNGFDPAGKTFTGEISRHEPLSKLLSVMELTGIASFKISGNTLNIYPSGSRNGQ